MKLLTIYADRDACEDLLDALRSDPDVDGFTVVDCQGHSKRGQMDRKESVLDRIVGYVPRVRIEVVLEDDRALGVLERLQVWAPEDGSTGTFSLLDLDQWGRL